MAQLMQAFDARNYDPTQSVGGLPVGKHPVIIESSEVKANSKNDGGYLQLNLKIIDGPSQGSTGAYRLNLYHSNQQTVEIAHRQLSAICHVVNVFNIQDSAQLHNIPFLVEVDFQKGEEARQKGYTEVKKVFDINGCEPGKAGQAPSPAQPAAVAHVPQAAAPVAPAPVQAAAPAPAQPATAWGQAPAQAPQQPAAPTAWGNSPAAQPASPAQPAAVAWQPPANPAAAPAPQAPWSN